MPGLGLATVYRTLRLLRKQGRVLELHSSDGSVHYDADTSVHYHFCCNACGRIVDLNVPVDASIERKVAASSGLLITGHQLMFTGVCPDCLQLQADEDELEPKRENGQMTEPLRSSTGELPSAQ